MEIGKIAISKGWNTKIVEDISILAVFSAVTIGLWRFVAYMKIQHQRWTEMAESSIPNDDDFRPEDVDWT